MAQAISNSVSSPFSITGSGKKPAKKGVLSTTTRFNPAIGSGIRLDSTGRAIPVANPMAGALMDAKKPAPVVAPQSNPVAPQPAAGSIPPAQLASTVNVQAPAQAPTAPAPAPVAAPKRGLFPDVVSSLASKGSTPSTAVSTGQEAYNKAVKDLADFRAQSADIIANQAGRGVPLEFVTGRQAALRQAALQKEQILMDAIAQAQTGIGLGQKQQEIEQSALGAAAGFAQPQLSQFGQGFYNPLDPTGAAAGGANALNPLNNIDSIAQQVVSGQISPAQAEAMGGSVANFAGALNQAILSKDPSYNRATRQAQFDANQSNVQTAGTAQTDIARAGLQEATQKYQNEMLPAAQFAEDQTKRVSDILAKTGLNNVSSTDYTKAINNLQYRFSNPDFTALNAALKEAQRAYTGLLATGGGTPTGAEEFIQLLDINQSAEAINSAFRELEAAVANRLGAQYSVIQNYQANLGGGGASPAGASSGGGSIWDF